MQLLADNHFLEGFFKSWGMILASEIGDKTFFIAAIMAMKHSRITVRHVCKDLHVQHRNASIFAHVFDGFLVQVYAGALSALAVMPVLSAVLGWAAPALVGHYAARALLVPAISIRASACTGSRP